MKKLLLLLSVVLSGCGGGAGNNTATPAASIQAVPQAIALSQSASEQYFIEKQNAFPDLTVIYNSLCGNATQIQFITPVDLNSDGKTDILAVAFCDLNGQKLKNYPYGSEYHGPMPTSLITFIQKNDGMFELGNQILFGKDIVDVAGFGKPSIGDFNNDGKPDVVIGSRLEDGRAFVTMPDGSSSWDSPVAVIMSTPTNKYTVEFLPKGMNNSVPVFKDIDGRDIFQASNSVWRYDNGTWIKKQPFNNLTGDARFFSTNNSNYSITSIWGELGIGVSLLKQVGSDWITQHNFTMGDIKKVDVYAPDFGNNGYSTQYLLTINNTDWLMPSVSDMCLANINGKQYVFAVLDGYKMRDRYNGSLITLPSNVSSYQSVSRDDYAQQLYIALIENEKITHVAAPTFSTQLNNFLNEGNGLKCTDMNNDRVVDVVFNRWGTNPTPYIFLNNNNTLTKVDDTSIPKASIDYTGGVSSTMFDFNNDGKNDLIYYPSQGYNVNSKVFGSGRFQLFLGSKLLN